LLATAWSNELTNDQPPDRAMASEILNYFVRNPHAVDTLEGVARWRLMDEVIRRKLHETEAALGWLVAHGYLTTSISPGGTVTFSLNPERAEESRKFLAQANSQDRGRSPP
jgi:hypothetical protein